MLAIEGVERARCESGARGVGRGEMKVGVMVNRDVYHDRRKQGECDQLTCRYRAYYTP